MPASRKGLPRPKLAEPDENAPATEERPQPAKVDDFDAALADRRRVFLFGARAVALEESLRKRVLCVSETAGSLSRAVTELAVYPFDAIVVDATAERGSDLIAAIKFDRTIAGVFPPLVHDAHVRNASALLFVLPPEGERVYSVMVGSGESVVVEQREKPPLLTAVLDLEL